MLKVLTVIDLVCLFFLLAAIFGRINIIKQLALSVTFFMFLYVVVSAFFFLADAFSFVSVLGMMAVGLVPATTLVLYRYRKKIAFEGFSAAGMGIPLLFIALMLVLSGSKFEYFGMGQDEGTYQTEAIQLYSGNFSVQLDFEEYGILTNTQDQEAYQEMVDNLVGYYPYAQTQTPSVNEADAYSDVSGTIHGFQTFPALLALFARLFGLANMMQLQTVLLICAVLLLYDAIRNLCAGTAAAVVSTALLIVSPIILWCSKSALTETPLLLIICCYLYFLTDADTAAKRLLMGVPLFVFAFMHVSFLMLYPIFILTGIILYLVRGHKTYLLQNVLASAGLCLGYYIMSEVSAYYFYINIYRIYFRDLITQENVLLWIYLGAALVSLVSLLFLAVRGRLRERLYRFVLSCTRVLPLAILALLAVMVVRGIILGWLYDPLQEVRSELYQYYGTGLQAFTHLTLYAIAMSTGFLVVPWQLYKMLRERRYLCSQTEYLVIWLLYIYCILFQSAFIRWNLSHYYYYSRYISFYLPLICLMAAAFLKQKKKKAVVSWLVVCLSLVLMLPFDYTLVTQKDDTYMEWETLLALSDAVSADAAVIIESAELQRIFALSLGALTDTAVFPVFEDLDAQIALLQETYTTVYYLTDQVEPQNLSEYTLACMDTYVQSLGGDDSSDSIYPLNFVQTEKSIYLYTVP